ncbi:MAG: DJ-1/PfpI family protein [Terricaulis sp.]
MSNWKFSGAEAPRHAVTVPQTGLSRRAVFTAGTALVAALSVTADAQTAERRPTPTPSPAPSVAFLLYDSACGSEFTGAWEVFRASGPLGPGGFQCFTLGSARSAIDVGGLAITPQYTFSDAPRADVIVTPSRNGGFASMSAHAPEIEWLRRASDEAQIVLAIGSGAFLLAEAGLLDGRQATTHHTYFGEFERQFPSIALQRDRRFVDAGDRITTGGYAGGIDAALHIVARRYGPDSALRTVGAIEHASDLWMTNQLQPGSARPPANAMSEEQI